MNYIRANIMFTDDKSLSVDVEKDKLDNFSKNVSQGEIFWNDPKTQGFWTDMSKIRYITFTELTKEMLDELQRKGVSEDRSEVSGQHEGTGIVEDQPD